LIWIRFLVPVVGMLGGSAVSAVVLAVSYILKEMQYVVTRINHDYLRDHHDAIAETIGTKWRYILLSEPQEWKHVDQSRKRHLERP
jgi:hypothetical protein